jgi:diguanylate cyclase (GGDEF)-like protein
LDELAGDIAFALQYIAKEEQLDYLAYYDSLTSLPNTRLFHERLSQALATRPTGIMAVVLLDLDRFTQLNDSLGRHVGDRLLSEVARRLQTSLAEPQLLARISSDTFAVAISALREETDAGSILNERILAALKRPFHIDEHELRVTARAGIALYPSDAQSTDGLFKNAEAALREAKTSGARYQFYSPHINARVAEDLAFEQKLLRAVEQQQFLVYYQPKVNARNGEVVGLEALVRWADPHKGLVPPNEFIPALEDTELILDVGRWVLGQAMADCRRWREQGLLAPQVAVNVSPVQLRYADFPDTVLAAVGAAGTSGADLELEITESVIMADIEANIDLLERISQTGASMAIDDFGTGYSSLRYLAKLPVQTLKIDRSFVVDMTKDADSMTLVSTLIGLAHSFDLRVVAEGVDSEEQAKLLRLMKCDCMQGYLFGKPMPAADIETLLRGRSP